MPGPEEFADRYAGQPADLDVEVPLHDGPDTYGIDPADREASREANLRAVDEAHWIAMEERLGAERDDPTRPAGQGATLPSKPEVQKSHGSRLLGGRQMWTDEPVSREATGPGYVAHLMDVSGSGLHACDGRPFDPIPDQGGAVVYPCTGCYVVGPRLVEERKLANLGNATTRQLLNELKARGEMVAAEHSADGQYMARMAHRMLHGHARLDDRLLDYRTVGN